MQGSGGGSVVDAKQDGWRIEKGWAVCGDEARPLRLRVSIDGLPAEETAFLLGKALVTDDDDEALRLLARARELSNRGAR